MRHGDPFLEGKIAGFSKEYITHGDTNVMQGTADGTSAKDNPQCEELEARVRIELTIEVLQTSALPLGYRAG